MRRRGQVAPRITSRRKAEASQLEQVAETFNWPEHGITCFHCGEVCLTPKQARLHFGTDISEEPGCLLKLREGDKGLLALVRFQYAELDRYRQEDQPIMREIYALGAKHARELITAEQRGYDCGLADGRAEAGLTEQIEISGLADLADTGHPPATHELAERPGYEQQPREGRPAVNVAKPESGPENASRATHPKPETLSLDERIRAAYPNAPFRPLDLPAPPDPAKSINLAATPSALDARFDHNLEEQVARVRQHLEAMRPEGLVPCRCGANGTWGNGLVPEWFGRDCIEAKCDLRGAR